jgi:GTPase KRas
VWWESYDPALEVPRTSKTITIDNQQCIVHVWEYNGADRETQERLIRSCEGVILIFSITSRESFEKVKTLYNQVRSIKDSSQVSIYLVGNKRDLEAQRQVGTIEAVVLAAKLRLGEPFYEVSAKTGENVDRVFYSVVREIRRLHAQTGAKRFFKSVKRVFWGV